MPLVVLSTLVPLSGCSGAIAGQWRAVEVVPNRQVFCIDDATFERDGTFSATLTREGNTREESGTYRFNGWKLILQPSAGGLREYGASLRFGKLEVISGDRKVVLRRK